MGDAAREIFGIGKPGFVIIVLVVLAIGSWIAELITTAINKAQITAMIRTGTQIASILAVIGVAWKLLTIFFNFTQGKM